jgi:hypothetical protein
VSKKTQTQESVRVYSCCVTRKKENSNTLLEIIADALRAGPIGQDERTAPMWIPRNGKDYLLSARNNLRHRLFPLVNSPEKRAAWKAQFLRRQRLGGGKDEWMFTDKIDVASDL